MGERVVVVTASLPERHEYRAECIRAVEAQTVKPVAHVVMIDHERVGPAVVLNRMLAAALACDADWIAQVADDDLLYPDHLQTLLEASAEADIVYSYCDVEGRDWFDPNAPFDAERLRQQNYIPATTLIRAELCRELGWRADSAHGFEDWDFWLRALDAGARFVCVEQRTWLYRFHGANLSYHY